LSIGCNTKADIELFKDYNDRERGALKQRLDELHKRKIDLADEVLVLNVGNYIGESTRSEIEYAQAHGKPIRYLESLEERQARMGGESGVQGGEEREAVKPDPATRNAGSR